MKKSSENLEIMEDLLQTRATRRGLALAQGAGRKTGVTYAALNVEFGAGVGAGRTISF